MSAAGGKLLIVEDEFVIAHNLAQIVQNIGYGVMGTAKSAEEALKKIKSEKPDLVLLDINIIGDKDGVDLAKEINETYKIPFIYITSYADTTTINRMNSTKPLGYILKPFDERDLRVALQIGFTNVREIKKPIEVAGVMESVPTSQFNIVGSSKPVLEALVKVKQVAKTDVTVLIQGETGTGKELFMEAIHQQSNRSNKKLIKVNCAALPSELIESVLFGHEKGSFTGATERRVGKFEMAHGGTLFLDEIGELPLSSQSKLLRSLQEKEIETVGGTETKKVDVRVIAATNRDLAKEVKKGNFRADLFFRLNVFPISIPPLRERENDIEELAYYFLRKISKSINKGVDKIDKNSMSEFKKYSWPGNIRELQHYIERGVILATESTLSISIDNLGAKARKNGESNFELITLQEAERQRIIKTLTFCNGKVRGAGGAAEILDIHPNTLDFRIKKLGIKKTKTYDS